MKTNLHKKFIERELNEKIKKIKNVADHGRSQVFLISTNKSKYILRINKDKYPISNNFSSLKFLKNSKITPKPILFKKFKDIYLSLEEFIEGEKVDFRKDKDKRLIKHLVKPLMEVHKIKNKKCGWDLLKPEYKSWKDYLTEMLHFSKKKFLKRLPKKEYLDLALKKIPNTTKFVLLHGDFSFTNAIFRKNKVFLFDFEDSLFGEKEFDLGLIYYMELFREEFLDELVKYSRYNKDKIIYYAFFIGIRKVANSPKRKLNKRIERLEKLKEVIK